MDNKYVCIHGHFYQPPRENAWLEVVELQDSAKPYHDWNERINFECYAPNTTARILDGNGFIENIINNYTKLSFNFGPTLLSWLELNDKETYTNILQADKDSLEKYNGHGSAVAQAHSHLILPLCNERDKETQVIWGIKDFEYRFGRKPEGMWLAETAVDTASLEVLAKHGIKYTILAPRQAKAVRKIGTDQWYQIHNDDVDSRRPYLCKLPSGNTISLYFYHAGIAQGVAFDGLLYDGKSFAHRFVRAFDNNNEAQLVNVATDGESYGHHHRFGEMALADCFNSLEKNQPVTITNYGEYLEKFPPTYEALIHENSSWSCAHGVERWRSNCGCNTGGNGGWNQEWRSYLRDTLNWLRDELIPIYNKEANELLNDPWTARNEYINILLNRTPERIDAFVKKHAKKKLGKANKTQLFRLMEMQRNALLMFTSCGWFFDEISGIETNQILQYACRAIGYAKQVSGKDLQKQFIKKLAQSPSNVYENGATSYVETVLPTIVGLERAGMHYAVASLFERPEDDHSLFNYIASSEVFDRMDAGTQRLAIGRTIMKSKVTHSEKLFNFAVLYLGQQNIIGNISVDMSRKQFDEMHDRISKAFKSTDLSQVIAIMQTYFGEEKYSIWHLFRDEKRKVLDRIVNQSRDRAENAFRRIYDSNYQLMSSMFASDIPIPKFFKDAAQHIVNADLHRFFEQDKLDIAELIRLDNELKKWNIPITDTQSFVHTANERLFYETKIIANAIVPIEHLNTLIEIFTILNTMDIEVDIWKSQNIYFSVLKRHNEGTLEFESEEWATAFYQLGKLLKVNNK